MPQWRGVQPVYAVENETVDVDWEARGVTIRAGIQYERTGSDGYERNKRIYVVGRSGTGKSTICNKICVGELFHVDRYTTGTATCGVRDA